MARKSSRFKLPSFKWVLFYALIIALPLTMWALYNTSTNTAQHASGDTAYCGYAPIWSAVLGHTDYATSVKYKINIYNHNDIQCNGQATFVLSATVPAGWSYKYTFDYADLNCALNQSCYMGPTSANPVYITISRPSNAKRGTYTIKLKATEYGSPVGTKNIGYVVN